MVTNCFFTNTDEYSIIASKEVTLEQQAIKHFEALVARTIANGKSINRKDALNHIMSDSTCNGDWIDMCCLRGLPYDYFSKNITA
jgi:hypothetical protein